jgi:hypothetical protein
MTQFKSKRSPRNGTRTKTAVSALYLAQAVIAFLVAGCSVGPRYKQPVSKLRPYLNAPAIESRSPVPPAPTLDTWWTGFNDPALTKIVERALAQNLDLGASFARVEQARAAAREAGANREPNFDFEGSDTSSRQSVDTPIGQAVAGLIPGFKRNENYLDLGIGATWETDIFGGLRRGAEAANAEAEAAEAERLGTRVSVVAEAADAYMQIRGAQVRLAFAKQQIETDEHLLRLVSQRRNAGVASDRELAQAEALLAQARATVPQLNIILEAQLNRLDVLMGAQPGTYAAELSATEDIPAIPGIVNTVDAAGYRPGSCRLLSKHLPRCIARQRSRNSRKPISRDGLSANAGCRTSVAFIRFRACRCRGKASSRRECRSLSSVPQLHPSCDRGRGGCFQCVGPNGVSA